MERIVDLKEIGAKVEELMMQDMVLWIAQFDFPALQSLIIHRFIRSMFMLYKFTQIPVLMQLRYLDISHSSGVTGVLSILLCHSFPKLSSLILSDCGLNSDDLSYLVEADQKGRLPELTFLDLSQNEDLKTVYESFFSRNAQWKKLKRLRVDKVQEGFDNDAQKCDVLVNLEEIKFNVSGEGIFDKTCRIQWPQLVKIEMACTFKGIRNVLMSINENDNLPLLKTVCLEVLQDLDMSVEAVNDLQQKLKQKLPTTVVEQVINSMMMVDKHHVAESFMSSFLGYMSMPANVLIDSQINELITSVTDKVTGTDD